MADKPVTAPDLTGWLTAETVLVRAALSGHRGSESNAVWTRIVVGMINACASRTASKQGWGGKWKPRLEPWRIPVALWAKHEHRPKDLWRGEAFFDLGDEGDHRYGTETYVHCLDIRFDPADVDREFPAPPQPPAPVPPPADAVPAPVASTGGRPPKEWWEDLWIEMAAQVWAGDIGPESKQSEIIEAMEKWVSETHDDYASPSTYKIAARKLLAALKARKGKIHNG